MMRREWHLTLLLICLQFSADMGTFVGPSFFNEPPSRVEFANDTGARIDCTAEGSPVPIISWMGDNGKPVVSIPQTLDILSNGSLLFLPFHPSGYRHDIHAATYRCMASNDVGKIVSRDIRVRAVVLQYYEIQAQFSKTVLRGNTAFLKCNIPSFVREYITITSWLQDSSFNIYPSLKGDGKYHMLPTGELLVRRVDDADKYRSYQCRAMNRLNAKTLLSVGRARLSVTDPRQQSAPRHIEGPKTYQVNKNQPIVLPCFTEGNPPPTFQWFRQERQQLHPIIEDERIFQFGECLIVLHAGESDAGLFVCIANNTVGTERLSITLQVKSPLTVTIQPSGQFKADIGSRAEIYCFVSGGTLGAATSRTWLKDSHVVGPATNSEKLVISRVQREDAGMYQCIVQGEDDNVQSSVQLILGVAHPQLLYKFIHQTLQPGPPVSLKCIAMGNPTPRIMWKLDGYPLPQNERFVIGQYVTLHGDVISHVNISNVQVEDGGIYQCTASNKVGEAVHSADMRVYGLPFIRAIPNISATAGEPLYIACPVAGYPIDSITWEKDGRKLPLNRRQMVFPNGTLVLENVQRDPDKGNYRCIAENKQGRSESQNLALNVIVPPRIAPFSFLMDLHEGDRAGVQCFITKGDLPLNIEWTKDGMPLESGISVRQLGEFTSSLSIESLAPHHAGVYTCQATNQAAKAILSSTLLVNVPPRIGPIAFGELIEGIRTQVQCVIQAGDQPMSLKWLKDDETIPTKLGIQIIQDTYWSTLAIPQVGREHTGNYSCIATNAAKSAQATAVLVVSVPPRWIAEPHNLNVTRGSVAKFDCQTDGFPMPSLVWRRLTGQQPNEYQEAFRTRGVQIFPNGTLLIRQAFPEHQGQYLCEATNGIGAGLSSTVSLIVYRPPEFEVQSAQVSVRRSASQNLECHVLGDRPMSIIWQRDGSQSPIQFNPRYTIKESTVKGGFLSQLFISSTIKTDSGTYSCIASNAFGQAERTVHLQVQDAPGKPHDLRILDTSSRSVKLSWLAPLDDRSPVLQYVVQYKLDSNYSNDWQSTSASTEQTTLIRDLLPASVYLIRVLAENELGAGEPSDHILFRTEGEAPTGEPQSLKIVSLASNQLKVTWEAPLRELWNGEILGYYIGYRDHGAGRLGGFNYSTMPPNSNGVGQVILSGLRKYRNYGIVVQAFNEKGPGPLTTEVVAQTLEDVPSAPPLDIICMAQSSQSLVIRWQPPPQLFQNGQLLGYKVHYENMEEWPPGYIEAETKMTTEVSTELHSLQKYSNYSLQVWAFTQVGDGVKSRPIYCMTAEDVPDAPAGLKVMLSSPNSLIVSWAVPIRTNGQLTSYTVYSRILKAGQERDTAKKKLSPLESHYQATNLQKGEAYEFWITAFTRIGEGQSTQVVYATISNRVPPAIISFGRTISVRRGSSVKMPCLSVGIPPPKYSWIDSEGSSPIGDNFSIKSDGSLEITDIQRNHQNNYTCIVSNTNGSDQITSVLLVLVPPSAPVLGISSTGLSWLHLQWKMVDNGGSAVRGFILNYHQDDSAEWEERSVSRDLTSYQLTGLACGVEYHLQMMAYNSVGIGAPSPVLVEKTDGNKPGRPSHTEFIEVNTTFLTLHLKSWNDHGCPILSYSIEYKEGIQEEWITVVNNVQARDSFVVFGLWPATQYIFKVKAINSAGFTTAEYRTSTLSILGATVSPDSVKVISDDQIPLYFEAGVLVPVTVFIMALIFLIAAITICLRKKHERENMGAPKSEVQSMVSLDNKQNLVQREQYYAAIHKGFATPERIPEYADDISPYATFHVAGSERPTSSPAHIQSFIYQDHHLTAMETMQLKSGNLRDDFTKLKRNTKNRKCFNPNTEHLGSNTDQWSEQNLTISLADRIPLQSILYSSSAGGLESSTSPEASPVSDRRTPRFKVHVRREDTVAVLFSTHLDPPSGFSDLHELSEAECDMDSFSRLKVSKSQTEVSNKLLQHSRYLQRSLRDKKRQHFTIAV